MPVLLQIRSRAGQERLTVEDDATLASFVGLLSTKTSIPASRLTLKAGFPPKIAEGLQPDALVSSHFPSGESVIVDEGDTPSVVVAAAPPSAAAGDVTAGSALPVDRPAPPSSSPPFVESGTAVRRVVDADNTCLFTSVAYALCGRDRAGGMALRDVVAREVLADVQGLEFGEAVLGMKAPDYAEWIRGKDHWGGAIDLAVLSAHFSAEIFAWDIQHGRCDRYGEGRGYLHAINLVYDGIHYDAMSLSMLDEIPVDTTPGAGQGKDGRVDGAGYAEDFDLTVFHPEDKFVRGQVEKVVALLKDKKQFVDTQNFSLRCLICQAGLVGEDDARQHAKDTGHQNFAQYD